MVIWLIGLSGAGKTTIGRALYESLRAENPATVFVDGDEVRDVFGPPSTVHHPHSVEGRRANSHRLQSLCAWLDGQGIDVVCCVLSIFEDARAENRDRFRDYTEIYVRAPLAALEQRQPQDLYGRARRGEISNVVGVDIDFPEPTSPDLVIDNGADPVDVADAVRRIRRHLLAS